MVRRLCSTGGEETHSCTTGPTQVRTPSKPAAARRHEISRTHGPRRWHSMRVSPLEYLAGTATAIRFFGWHSAETTTPSWQWAETFARSGSRITDEDRAIAAAASAWAQENRDDVVDLLNQAEVTVVAMSRLAALVRRYQQHERRTAAAEARRANPDAFLPEGETPIEVAVIVLEEENPEGDRPGTRYTMETETGQRLVWDYYGKPGELRVKCRYRLRVTSREAELRDGIPVTRLRRAKALKRP